eukprot:3705594-Prorocentrum_lima.AAC.1
MRILRRISEELNRRLEDVMMQVHVFVTEREPVGAMIGHVAGMKKDLHHLQQDFTLMQDNMASE